MDRLIETHVRQTYSEFKGKAQWVRLQYGKRAKRTLGPCNKYYEYCIHLHLNNQKIVLYHEMQSRQMSSREDNNISVTDLCLIERNIRSAEKAFFSTVSQAMVHFIFLDELRIGETTYRCYSLFLQYLGNPIELKELDNFIALI